MGIELDVVNEQPAINRNRVFLTELKISQIRNEDDTRPPVYRVEIHWLMYGVDATGKRHFIPTVNEVEYQDYLNHATAQAAEGDTRHIEALRAIEHAIAGIIADEMRTTATVI